jgi:hypothetical protein
MPRPDRHLQGPAPLADRRRLPDHGHGKVQKFRLREDAIEQLGRRR